MHFGSMLQLFHYRGEMNRRALLKRQNQVDA